MLSDNILPAVISSLLIKLLFLLHRCPRVSGVGQSDVCQPAPHRGFRAAAKHRVKGQTGSGEHDPHLRQWRYQGIHLAQPQAFCFSVCLFNIQSVDLYSTLDRLPCFLSLHRTRNFSRRPNKCCRTARQRSTSSACRSERPCRPRSSPRTINVVGELQFLILTLILQFLFHPTCHSFI